MSNAGTVFGYFTRAEKGIIGLERVLIFILMIFQVVILTIQVLSRYVFNNPLDYTEEASRFALIWLVFIGTAHAAYLNEHFIVTLLVDWIKFPGKKAYLILVDLVVIGFFIGLIFYGVKIAWKNPRIEPALDLSIGWAYLAIPVGCLLTVYHLMLALIRVRIFGDETYEKYESDYDRIPGAGEDSAKGGLD